MILFHPNYIIRVAAESPDLLSLASTGATARIIAGKKQLQRDIADHASGLITLLESKVRGSQERDLRRALINSKRALHNRRLPKKEDLARCRSVLSIAHRQQLDQLIGMIEQDLTLGAEIERTYESEIKRTADQLHQLWSLPRLQLGLSYASPQLFAGLQGFFASDRAQLKAKKIRHFEDALLQFASRCMAKTSPLSFFTPVYLGRWDKSGNQSLAITLSDQLQNRIEIKAGLIEQILDPWLKDYSATSPIFELKVNSSVDISANKVRFLQVQFSANHSGKTWGTGASQVELDVNPIIRCILHVFQQRQVTSLSAQALADGVCQAAPKLPRAAVLGFIQKLFDIGFLLIDDPYFAQSDRLQWAEAMLAASNSENTQKAVKHLQDIGRLLEQYKSEKPSQRCRMYSEIADLTTVFARSLNSHVQPEVMDPPFFENTYVKGGQGDLSEHSINSLVPDFEILVRLAPLLDSNHRVRTQCADHFVWRYGPEAILPNALDFIREIDQSYAPGHVDPDSAIKGNQAPPSDIYHAFGAVFDAYEDIIADALSSDGDVEISRSALSELINNIPSPIRQRSISYSYVGQFIDALNEPKFVVNQVFGGRSSLFSRFQEGQDEEGLETVRKYLKQASGHGNYAEVPALFGFNANRHPRLADAELSIPPYSLHYADTRKVDITSLSVQFNPDTHSIEYVEQNGQAIDLWYQGFLIAPMLPQVQRVLTMSANDGLNFYAMGTMVSRKLIDADKIMRFPRLTLGRIVLSRRMWIIPRALVPSTKLSEVDFFAAIQQWVSDHGLPQEAFIRVAPVGEDVFTDPSKQVNWENLVFKDLKPFYVRFDHIRLVRLLCRVMRRNDFPITVTEVLPSLHDRHVNLGQVQSRVAEMHFEFSYNPKLAQNGTVL